MESLSFSKKNCWICSCISIVTVNASVTCANQYDTTNGIMALSTLFWKRFCKKTLGETGLVGQGIVIRIGRFLVQTPIGTWSGLGTQPRYIEIVKMQELTLDK